MTGAVGALRLGDGGPRAAPAAADHRDGEARLAGQPRRAHRARRARATSSRSSPTRSTGCSSACRRAFASQRRFVANASHELRTPLTVIRTELDVTLADPDATNADLRAMGETVRDATLDTERLIQALLTLARSEGGVTPPRPGRPGATARGARSPRRAPSALAAASTSAPALDPAPVPRRPAAARAPGREPRRERRPPQRRRRDGRDS